MAKGIIHKLKNKSGEVLKKTEQRPSLPVGKELKQKGSTTGYIPPSKKPLPADVEKRIRNRKKK
jgi:hypothetical protein